ncbi:hypothetical protein RU96_GL002366 [Enterococcus canintestini]|uniref:Uncharacterized protein n=1 Tax=Enterococcus canintestini TaxID=317010 RepID=A0A1L8R6I1_9ENTE|nr:hypothetical protein RU96_GL002366 [Enterococcus canintestini]
MKKVKILAKSPEKSLYLITFMLPFTLLRQTVKNNKYSKN